MKKLLLFTLLILSLLSCRETSGVLVEVYNPSDKVRVNEMVELDYADVMHRLGLPEDTSVIVLDVHGFQVYYQITFKNKLIFMPHPIGAGMTDYYRIVPGVPEEFTACAVGAQYGTEGEIAWENGRIAFAVNGPQADTAGEHNCGYDVWVKRSDTPVVPAFYAAGQCGDSIVDCYEVGASLGAGATALLDAQGNMVYPRRCEAYKILNDFSSYDVGEKCVIVGIISKIQKKKTKKIKRNVKMKRKKKVQVFSITANQSGD